MALSIDLAPFIATALTSLVSALVGGLIVHWLSKSRDALNRRRELRVEFLSGAYRKFVDASDRDVRTPDQTAALESAVLEILLVGNAEEIRVSEDALIAGSKTGVTSMKAITTTLRRSLRRELGLPQVSTEIDYLRVQE